MNLYTLTFKSIFHKKLRISITLLGVSISIAAFISLVGLADNFKETLKTTYESRETDLIVIEKGVMDIFSSSIDERYAEKIMEIPEVRDISAILVDLYILDISQYVLVYGWNSDSYLLADLQIEGAYPCNQDEAIIGQMTAKRLRKKTGDRLVIRGNTFKVAGVFASKSIFEEASIIIPLDKFQEMKGSQGKVTMFNIRLKRELGRNKGYAYQKNMTDHVRSRILRMFPDVDVRNIQSFVSNDNPLFAAVDFAWAISTCAFIIAVLGILNTMTTSVVERIQEIGILLALGWRKSRIIILILFEAVTLSLAGGLLGIVLGHGFMISLASSTYLQGVIRVSINPVFILKACLISILIGILSGIYPAIKAISVDPIKILRYEQ